MSTRRVGTSRPLPVFPRFAGLLALLLLGLPGGAGAQVGVPGLRIESERIYRARVRAEMYRTVTEFFASWRSAWNDRDADALARLYADEAALRLPGQAMVRGHEDLVRSLRSTLASASSMTFTDLDFDSNGEVSLYIARFATTREGVWSEGLMTAILFRSGRNWRLRAHMFDDRADAGGSPAAER